MRYLILRRKVAILPCFRTAAFAVAMLLHVAASACNAQDSHNVVQAFRAKEGGERLLIVPTRVFGRTINGVIDTGSDVSLYDVGLRPLLGPVQGVTKVDTPQGGASLQLFIAPRPSLRTLELQHDTGMVLCHDLGALRNASKTDVQVILGMDVLRTHILRLNSRQGVIEFLKDLPPYVQNGVSIADDGSGPTILAAVEGFGDERFVIDTGSVGIEGNTLSKKAFDALARSGRLAQEGDAGAMGVLGSSRKRCGRLRTAVTVGTIRQTGLIFCEGDQSALGLSYFSRFDVVFDFRNQFLYLGVPPRGGQPRGIGPIIQQGKSGEAEKSKTRRKK